MASYTYTVGVDFTSLVGTVVDLSALQTTIAGSLATVQYLTRLSNVVTIFFSGALSGGEQTTLTGIINAYTYIDVTETVVSNTSTTTLSNKSLPTDTNFFIDPTDNTKKFAFNISGNGTGRTFTLAGTATSTDKIITFPNITDTVGTLTASQTFTNKTITNGVFNGTGSSTAASSSVYINPSSTTFSGSNNYFFTYLNTPATTGSTTGTASTLLIGGAPANASTAFSLNIASGASLFGGNLTISNGNTFNVGTSGITSTLNVFGPSNHSGIATFTGTGNTTAASSTIYSNPASTAITGSSSYFFNYFNSPTTVPTTFTGTASTVFIAGAPTSTTGGTGFAFNVGSGNSLFTGNITLNSTSSVLALSGASSTLTLANTTASTSSTTGAIQVAGGGYFGANSLFAGNLTLNGTSAALILSGTSSSFTLSGTTAATSSTAAASINSGGASIAKNIWIGTNFSNTLSTVNGAALNIATLTYTDASTAASGTAANVNLATIRQPTFAATNATVTTTRASTFYVEGAPIRGTNETFTNTYGIYIAAGSTTSATITEASSLLVENAPTVTSGTSYAVKVNSGKTYLGGVLQIPTGAVSGYVLTSDGSGNASWNAPVSANVIYIEAIANSSLALTNTTALNITGMTATPTVAGTYKIIFITYVRVSNNGRIVTFRLAKNGTVITNTTTALTVATSNFDIPVVLQCIATANGTSDVFTAQAFINSNTYTMEDYRYFYVERISA